MSMTSEQIAAAREWMLECDQDEEWVEDLTAEQVERVIARQYGGGVAGFIQTFAEDTEAGQSSMDSLFEGIMIDSGATEGEIAHLHAASAARDDAAFAALVTEIENRQRLALVAA